MARVRYFDPKIRVAYLVLETPPYQLGYFTTKILNIGSLVLGSSPYKLGKFP